ncbi:glycerol-1-phosphate dehydrogenase [NAD(P)+] [Ereboglobus sp. PH5-10]|uniref:sn-glycerol-1-phosphate dehydrogenase n=1 Tax=Ereboglobus sp. PH5-10 TaxID=2940629 RepID=UPI002406EAB7|nr:sn-glycerol-1-phosphate dehydrogenase [Ereboglobus sp. PH5-10]MDF9827196.1 glycerol-1-phosphate dehydrogenase [NAD(P)+] [Ereboglobus sp. PH5-10]
MTPNVENALKAATDTKALLVGRGVLREAAPLFKEQFGDKRALIVADTTTFGIAGRDVAEFLRQGGVPQDEAFVFSEPEMHAEYRHVEALAERLRATDAIPVAVGSGTVNDLCKLAAHLVERPYMIVGTAASMDGYTSFGASITADGAKQTFNCPAPRAVLADLDIFARAPADMTAAGYADLFSKVTAGGDWLVADMLAVEPIIPRAWDIVQGGLADALGDPAGVRSGDAVALGKLVEGLMLAGFAMQYSRISRPASGAEHYISHLWDMEGHRYRGHGVSHGFQVAVGTVAILAFYEQLFKHDLAALDIERCCAAWPELAKVESDAMAEFGGTVFRDRVLSESRAKYINKEQLAAKLALVKQNWAALKPRLEKQLLPVAEAQRLLRLAGAPAEPEDVGASRAQLRRALTVAPMLRNRVTVLDLAHYTGLFDACIDGLFGKGGRWEI